MAKSQKPKSKKRQRGRRPGRTAGAGGRPRRTDQPTPEEFELDRLIADADAARQRLAGHPDFRAQDEPGELSWWGRELTKMERKGMLAQMREQFGAEAALEAQQSDERPRLSVQILRRASPVCSVRVGGSAILGSRT